MQPQPFLGAAVVDHDDHVLRHVDQTAGQVAGVGRSQRRVGQTLATAVGRDEVFQHRQAFAEVRLDRQLDDPAGRVGHQAAHTGHLADLVEVTTRRRVDHHRHRAVRVQIVSCTASVVCLVAVCQISTISLVALLLGDQTAADTASRHRHLRRRNRQDLLSSASGISISSMPTVMPPRVAYLKPSDLILSACSAVRSEP